MEHCSTSCHCVFPHLSSFRLNPLQKTTESRFPQEKAIRNGTGCFCLKCAKSQDVIESFWLKYVTQSYAPLSTVTPGKSISLFQDPVRHRRIAAKREVCWPHTVKRWNYQKENKFSFEKCNFVRAKGWRSFRTVTGVTSKKKLIFFNIIF